MRKIHAREKQHRLTQKTITPFTVGSPKMADNTMETTLSANVKRGTVDIYKSGAGSDKGRDCSIIQGNKDRNILPTWRYAWWASRRTSTASLSAGRSSQQWIRNWKKLYTSESTREVKLLEDFFGNLNIPSICEREKPLEEPISLEEVILAIRRLQGSKAPGPDSYTPEFYKTFSMEIAPLLLDVFNESSGRGLLPKTFDQASISLIHKKR